MTTTDRGREQGDPSARAGLSDPSSTTVDSLAEALMAVGRHAAKALAIVSERLRDAGLLEEQPPADPKARALWLRQHRNTGPTQRQRTPHHLDTTARRRTR